MDAMKFLLELDSSLQASRLEAVKEAEIQQHSEDRGFGGIIDDGEMR
jgi:hypothetical protein